VNGAAFAVQPNGEVEGPGTHVSQVRLARNIDRVQARPTTHASRPPLQRLLERTVCTLRGPPKWL